MVNEDASRQGVAADEASALPRLAITFALAIAAYGQLWPVRTLDLGLYLIPWLDHISRYGPIGAFAHPFSNYTPPYLYVLAAASPLLAFVSKISVVKGVAVLGALCLAWSVKRLLVASGAKSAARGAALALLLPTVMLNSALLGQCDAYWAAPCLLAAACAIERRMAPMLIWCGIAVSVKAQAVFIAPFILAVLFSEKAPWRLWLIPPAVYIAMMVPAWAAGWPASDLATIYLNQSRYFTDLSMNAPNLWMIVQQMPGGRWPAWSQVAIAAALAGGVAFVTRFRRPLAAPDMIAAALLSSLMLPGLLPRMHDRYFFLADVLSLVLALRCRDRSSIFILVAVQTASLLSLWSYFTADTIFVSAAVILMVAATAATSIRLLGPVRFARTSAVQAAA